MRAFVISLDAVVAISVVAMMLVIVAAQDFHPSAPSGAYLRLVSFDILSVLEKSGRFSDALSTGISSGISEVLEAAPLSACMQVSINDPQGQPVLTVIRSGCSRAGQERQSAYTLIIHEGQPYVARIDSWRKEAD